MSDQKLVKKIKKLTKRVDRLEELQKAHLRAIDMNTALILKIKERDKDKFDGILKEVMLEAAMREAKDDNRP